MCFCYSCLTVFLVFTLALLWCNFNIVRILLKCKLDNSISLIEIFKWLSFLQKTKTKKKNIDFAMGYNLCPFPYLCPSGFLFILFLSILHLPHSALIALVSFLEHVKANNSISYAISTGIHRLISQLSLGFYLHLTLVVHFSTDSLM